MSKYQKSIIYKIFDNTNSNVYYGSTYNLLRVRMQGHRADAKRNRKCRSQSIILNNDYSYSMIEPYPCNSKQELKTRERYWIENFDCVNKMIPGQTSKEYKSKNKEELKKKDSLRYIKNKEHVLNQHADYYAKNKDKILEKNATKIVCECGSELSNGSIAPHRKSTKHANLMALICPPCMTDI